MDIEAARNELEELLGGDHSGCEDQRDAEKMGDAWGNDWLDTLCRVEELYQDIAAWESDRV